jgi:hypothetical protein
MLFPVFFVFFSALKELPDKKFYPPKQGGEYRALIRAKIFKIISRQKKKKLFKNLLTF